MGERPTLILTTRLGVRPLGVRGDPLHAVAGQLLSVIRRRLGDGRWGHLSGQVGDEPCLQLIIQRNDDAWMQAPPGFFS